MQCMIVWSIKVVYDIKLSSMKLQIKNPIKDQFCYDNMLKSKKYSKSKNREKQRRKYRISHYEFSFKKGTTSFEFKGT